MAAAQDGHVAIVERLLENGADANARNVVKKVCTSALRSRGKNGYVVHCALVVRQNGWTVLMGAAQHGHTEVVRRLLLAQANVHEKEAVSIMLNRKTI